MKHTFGEDVEFLHVDSRRAEQELATYVPEYNWGDVDIILVCGSPFLGVDINNTKCIMLKQAKERWSHAKKIAIGVGSSFRHNNVYFNNYFDYSDRNANSNQKAIDNTKELFENFDLVVTRDSFTQQLFEMSGIKSEMYFDTSAFYYSGQLKGNDRLLFIYSNPMKSDYWGHAPEGVWEIYNKTFLTYVDSYTTIVTTSQDKAYLDSINIKSLFCTDVEYLKYLYSNADVVVSTKVHQAIFAQCCGCCNVSLYPVDSRSLTAVNFGIGIVQPEISLDTIPQHKTDYRLESIRKQGGKGRLIDFNKPVELIFEIDKVMEYLDWYKERLVNVIV
jgi:hypothetical protein